MIERRPQRRGQNRQASGLALWAWPTVLSLDAPLVALAWQGLFAASYELPLAWPYPVILALSVWLIYAGDRLLDGLSLDLNKYHTQRHAFYVYYRPQLTCVWLATFVLSASLALTFLPQQDLMLGVGLSCAVTLYMLGTHLFKALTLSKEGLIGLVFGVAASLPLWGLEASLSLGLAALLLAALASLNCLLIAFWERKADTAQAHLSSMKTAPELARTIAPSLLTLSFVCFASGLAIPLPIAFSAAFSALLMLWLKSRENLSVELKRVLADAALLTPLVFLARGAIF